eukprot:TRINITY_DN107253_c0_g1_i1.p1 TRINITY_DN107253_c0_g1~~TRINITY_DN107253_c0_g1_i1.p1  ORF type:complete len:648 (-),score=118.44 TRINITY_DN107253_c0_g1_i1:54-1955(-)
MEVVVKDMRMLQFGFLRGAFSLADGILGLRTLRRQFAILVALILVRRVLFRMRQLGNYMRSVVDTGAVQTLKKTRKRCETYKEFKQLGEEIDKVRGLEAWKLEEESPHYDAKLINERTRSYKEMKDGGDITGTMFCLRSELLRKHFGLCNPALFEVCASGTKRLVEDYVSTVCDIMTWVAFSHRDVQNDASDVSLPEKLAFFNETRHSFGRSALLLSGGACLGKYHFGVLKALHLNGVLPKIISGSSTGSVICGVLCTRTDAELMEWWSKSANWLEIFNLDFFSGPHVKDFIKKGGKGLWSSEHLGKALQENMGDCTFLEAYDRTGRICNITVSGLSGSTRYPMLLNYLTAPHVLIWSASLASCSVPGIFEPRALLAKNRQGKIVPYLAAGLEWQDGSMQNDLPITRLAELFNVNFFIVSQVNPHARIVSGMGVGSPSGPLFAIQQFVRRQIKEFLLSFTEMVMKNSGRRVSPWLRPMGILPGQGLMVQEYTGDITIWSGGGLLEAHTLLQNPTQPIMQKAVAEAERETWWYIPQIKNACAIEFVMDEIIAELQAELSSGSGAQPGQALENSGSWSALAGSMDKKIKRMPSFLQGSQPEKPSSSGMEGISSRRTRRHATLSSATSLANLAGLQ